jgi:signal transduction histidine kinase/FixJ family two-component response regulator
LAASFNATLSTPRQLRQWLIFLIFLRKLAVPARLVKAEQLLWRARLVIGVGFALVLAAALAVAIGLARSRNADMWVVHTLEVQRAAQTLLISTRDAESALRSFLLSSDPDDLQPFDGSLAAAETELDKLRSLTADNNLEEARLKKLDGLLRAKAEQLNKGKAFAKEGQRDAALTTINSHEDRELLAGIREEIETILTTEHDLLAQRQARAAELRYVLAALIGFALLAAMVLAAVLAVSTRDALRGLIVRTAELEAESKLRHEAEATLRQSQKMEAVGQLSGGIAHDFNNLLTIIIGNLDTIRRQLEKAPQSAIEFAGKLAKPVESALKGANNAARLTQRLLAFSRRQALEPVRVDLNRLVTDMLEILRRSLGEDISIETVLAAGLWPTFIDPHQVESVVLNLALNAKAAMPRGGHLTIETANAYLDDAYTAQFGDVDPGQYVLLCVTDTGTGIAYDILDRVFEPFFTTKPRGEGSGLGLAMVHGFVKQSDGHIRIYSEEGQGTTVKIYLPRSTQSEKLGATPAGKPLRATPTPGAREHETILVVEDNDGVRDYAKEVLETLGYRVLEAADANEALRLLTDAKRIDLLFTDVVLPGAINGRVLAEHARDKRSDLPVLYTTGYTRNAIVHQGRLDPDVHLLNKPYTQQDLGRKVRVLLDASRPKEAPSKMARKASRKPLKA